MSTNKQASFTMANGWQTVPLGKILKRVERFEIKDDLQTYHFAGTYSFARGIFAGEKREGPTFRLDKIQRIHKGDFIYCKIMAWEGAFGIAPEQTDNCVMSGAFVVYEIDQTTVDPKFLGFYFKQEPVWKIIGSQSTGTNVRRRSLHPNQFEKATIPLPPLTEQRRIVARIEALAARVAEAQSLRREASEELNKLINSFVSHEWFSEKYSKGKFGDVLLEAKNGIYKPPDAWGHGMPCIRMYNIAGPGMNTNNLQLLEVTEEEFETYGCKPGDLIFNRVNSAELVGKTGLITEDYPQCTFESKNIRLRLDINYMQPKFAATILNSHNIRQYYLSVLKQQCGMATLNHTHLKNIPIPIPPLEEQRRLVAYLDGLQAQVSQLRAHQEETRKELDALMPSILDKVFRGEL